MNSPRPHFDGATYEPDQDQQRLASQLERVKQLMADQQWRTLAMIATAVGCSEAGASARLRDLRKKPWGRYRVDRRRMTLGLWQYRVLPPIPSGQIALWQEGA